jgi:hypothetical protein
MFFFQGIEDFTSPTGSQNSISAQSKLRSKGLCPLMAGTLSCSCTPINFWMSSLRGCAH